MKKFRTPLVTAIAIGLLGRLGVGVAAQDDAAVSDESMSPPSSPDDISSTGARQPSRNVPPPRMAWSTSGATPWAGITVESSDPRLTGEAAFVLDRDIYPGGVGAGWGTTLITNENGSWTGSGASLVRPGDGISWAGLDRLTGTGDYEGLSVVLLEGEGNGEFEAVIFPARCRKADRAACTAYWVPRSSDRGTRFCVIRPEAVAATE